MLRDQDGVLPPMPLLAHPDAGPPARVPKIVRRRSAWDGGEKAAEMKELTASAAGNIIRVTGMRCDNRRSGS